MNFNRTNLLLIGAIVLLLATVVGFIWTQNIRSQKNPTPNDNYPKSMNNLTIKNDLQKYGIEVISSSDFNFDAELKQYVGRYDEVTPLVNAAKPFALFIKNNSSKEIVGISLQWEFVKFNGESNKISQMETSPGVLLGMKPYDPFMVGKTSLINNLWC